MLNFLVETHKAETIYSYKRRQYMYQDWDCCNAVHVNLGYYYMYLISMTLGYSTYTFFQNRQLSCYHCIYTVLINVATGAWLHICWATEQAEQEETH